MNIDHLQFIVNSTNIDYSQIIIVSFPDIFDQSQEIVGSISHIDYLIELKIRYPGNTSEKKCVTGAKKMGTLKKVK